MIFLQYFYELFLLVHNSQQSKNGVHNKLSVNIVLVITYTRKQLGYGILDTSVKMAIERTGWRIYCDESKQERILFQKEDNDLLKSVGWVSTRTPSFVTVLSIFGNLATIKMRHSFKKPGHYVLLPFHSLLHPMQ